MFSPNRNSPKRASTVSPFSFGSSKSSRRRSGTGSGVLSNSTGSGRYGYEQTLTPGAGLNLTSNWANSSVTIEEAPTHRVVSYGTPLPVQVVEAINTQGTAHISCKFDPSGWAWLVRGKKLYIWKYVPSAFSKSISCYDLHLSSTELYHKADLTCVVTSASRDSGTPYRQEQISISVMSVSPEGIIRFWPNLSNPGIFIETVSGLNGKECYMLMPVLPYGCMLVTSTNELLMLTPTQSSIACKQLSASVSMLSGFSRRVSSFVFGAASNLPSNQMPRITVGPESDERHVYVLTGGGLQKWELTGETEIKEKLVFHIDLLGLLKVEIANTTDIDPSSIKKIVSLDIQSTGYCLVVLACAVIENDGHMAVLFLGTLSISCTDSPAEFESFIPLNSTFSLESEDSPIDFRLIVPAGSYQAFIFNTNTITSNPVSEVSERTFKIEFPNEGSKLVGGGSFGNEPVFLSRRHGLLTVNVLHKDQLERVSKFEDPVFAKRMDATSGENEGLSRKSENDASLDDEEAPIIIIRKAFLEHSQNNMFEAQELAMTLPSDCRRDNAIVDQSREILDDTPASDPRWAESSFTVTKGVPSSVLIQKQLEDKINVHAYLIRFLVDVDLWDKLYTTEIHGRTEYVKFKICEHAEKLQSARMLQLQYLEYTEILQKSIGLVVERRKQNIVTKDLTDADYFFCEVSKIEEFFPAIMEHEEKSLPKLQSAQEQIDLITKANGIVIDALREAHIYRQSQAILYEPKVETTSSVEYIPWTATGDMRNMLRKQVLLTEEKALVIADSTKTGLILAQQARDLSDLLLDGYITQLQSLRNEASLTEEYIRVQEEYENDRRCVITPLIEQHHLELALSLAEKYRDFAMLVTICEKQKDTAKLEYYKQQFADKGFLDFLFKWYMDRGEWAKLMNQEASGQLETFLTSHDQLLWLHQIGTGDFEQAFTVLMELAKKEKHYLSRKKTMLSMSKLCLLSTRKRRYPLEPNLKELENELQVVLLQEILPKQVLENCGLDADNMPPLSPEELIELYTGDHNQDANEFDFKRAIDLLPLVEKERKDALLMSIWSRAILKDDWTRSVVVDPNVTVAQTTFGKCATLVLDEGDEMARLFPTYQELLHEPKLTDLTESKNFVYLIKAFYEHLTS